MKSSDLAGGAKGEEEYDRTENEQDRGTAGAGAAQEQRRQAEWKNSLPSPNRRLKPGKSNGVDIIKISLIPANISTETG